MHKTKHNEMRSKMKCKDGIQKKNKDKMWNIKIYKVQCEMQSVIQNVIQNINVIQNVIQNETQNKMQNKMKSECKYKKDI